MGGEKEYEFLELDDFFITHLINGTEEQQILDITGRRKGKGKFTDFIKQFVGEEKFYVRGPTPYWKKMFTCGDLPRDMIFFHNKQCQGGGSKRRKYKRKKSKKRKSKRRKSKKSRKKKTRRRSR